MQVPGSWRAGLDGIIDDLCKAAEQGDAMLDGFNSQLRRLAETGILGPSIVFGPVVVTRPYPVGVSRESGQAVQAVLALPGGFGVIYWDTEEAASFDPDESRDKFALRQVTPFEECEPAIRGLIAPCAGWLVQKLLGRIEM